MAADVLVIVPTFNEVDNLERTVGRLRQTVPHAHVLVIDDASPDGTGAVADRLAADDPGVEVLHRTTRGYRSAVLTGFANGLERDAAYLVVVDADGSFDLDLLPEMLEAATSGGDLVIASRWVPGGDVRNMSQRRRLLSRAGNAYARSMLHTEVRDLTGAFRIYSASILRAVRLDRIRSDTYAFQIELAVRIAQAGGRIIEMPVEFTERALGASKMRPTEVLDTLATVTRWSLGGRRARPKRKG